jgi:hypothetical protein
LQKALIIAKKFENLKLEEKIKELLKKIEDLFQLDKFDF